jgi:transcriptional regulator with XRE-family HTH domain
MANSKKFISAVKLRMANDRMSIVYLAERSGVSRKRLTKILNGALEPTPHEAIQLATVLEQPAQLLNTYCSNCLVKRHLLDILGDYGIFLPQTENELIREVNKVVKRKLADIEKMVSHDYPANTAATMETKMIIAAELATLADMLTATKNYYKM